MSAIETPSGALVGDSETIRTPSAFSGTYDTGDGGGGATASYWVLEEDGTSKWQLEEGNGFWITEESA